MNMYELFKSAFKEFILKLAVSGKDGKIHFSLLLSVHITKYPRNSSNTTIKNNRKFGKR